MNCGDRFASVDVLKIIEQSITRPDIIYGDAIIQYPTFDALYPKHPLTKIWKKMPFCHQATFAKRALLAEHPFDLNYRLSADYDFLYKMYTKNKKFEYIDKVICFFDFKDSISKRNPAISIAERRQIALKNKFTIWRWLYYFFFTLYIELSVVIKRIIGNSITAWVTKFLRT